MSQVTNDRPLINLSYDPHTAAAVCAGMVVFFVVLAILTALCDLVPASLHRTGAILGLAAYAVSLWLGFLMTQALLSTH